MTTTQIKHSPWLVPLLRQQANSTANASANTAASGESCASVNASASTANVFFFPYAGAGASIYRHWGKLFPSTMNLFAIQAPGRETRYSEPFISSITTFAGAVANAIEHVTDEPIVLFGHSLGAACAYETARALERADRTPALLVVSGRQCPGTVSKRAPISHLSDAQFLEHVRTYKGTPAEVLENEELMELLLPLLRADFALSEHYKSAPEPLLTCPILGVGSTSDEWLDEETLSRWNTLTKGIFESHWFEGDHFYLNHRTEELVSLLRKKMNILKHT